MSSVSVKSATPVKLCVPCNFEPEIIEGLRKINESSENHVYEVYASLPLSIVGHCKKMTLSNKPRPMMELEDFVAAVHNIGIRFNYVMNVTCLGNVEYTAEGRREIDRYLQRIYDAGVDSVTVANPLIIEIIRSRYPGLEINVSLTSEVNSVHKAKYYEQLGASRITLDYNSNRDFKYLTELQKHVSLPISLLTNDMCIYDCAYRLYHYAMVAHASKEGKAHGECIDYCLVRCTLDMVDRTSELLKSPWIRPEDMSFYQSEFGINFFKVAGRQQDYDWVLRAAEAFAHGKWEGNLLTIMAKFRENAFPDWSKYEDLQKAGQRAGMTFGEFKTLDFTHGAAKDFLDIDNRKLDDFIKGIAAMGGCGQKECETCGYCDAAAKRFITVTDPEKMARYRDETERALSGIISGSVHVGEAVPTA